jgi:hypothetical protein
MGIFGPLLLAAVFFASGATFLKNAKAAPAEGSSARGSSTVVANRKKALGVFMIVLGALVTIYWLVSLL